MNFSPKQMLYLYVLLLFVFTFLLVTRIIAAIKLNEYNYFRLGLNAAMVVLSIVNIIKYNKLNDN